MNDAHSNRRRWSVTTTCRQPLSGSNARKRLATGVPRIETAYNTQGLVEQVTSYSAATGGTGAVVNQIQRAYNGLGQLTNEYQAHAGAVSTASTLSVAYAYANPDKGGRLASITYPSGKVLSYNYGTSHGVNDVIGRLDNLSESGQTLESYSYLGLGTVVERLQNQTGIKLTYVAQGTGDHASDSGGSDPYVGLDRFGRVVDQRWRSTGGSPADVDRYGYTYDRSSNRTSKANALYSTFDETYDYDGLDRLNGAYRWNGSGDYDYDHGYGSRMYNLDALGNMKSISLDGAATTRAHNQQNQLTDMDTGVSGTLSYDNNGNVTLDDQGHTLVYDAWNRLVEVKSGGTTLRTYAYDGVGRRITEDTPSTDAVEVYYSDQWQVLEERTGSSGLTLHAQYVWSPVYVDALVLRDYDYNASGTFTVGERVYALQDANFNVTALVTWQTGTTWAVSERFLNDPYGKFTTYDGSWNVQNDTLLWNYQHQGLRLDRLTGSNTAGVSTDGTGWYDNRYRVYSSAMMRWAQQEPFGAEYIDGMNLYEYVGDNPITGLDPDGLKRIVFAFEGYPLGPGRYVNSVWKGVVSKADPEADFKYYQWNQAGKAVADATRILKEDKDCTYDTFIAIGFSYGGNAAIEFTKKLGGANIAVNAGFTADPRHPVGLLGPILGDLFPVFAQVPFNVPANADVWNNFYQNGEAFLGGASVRGAQIDRELFANDMALIYTPAAQQLAKEPYKKAHSQGWIL
jgi:RHS repeat-associated protein